TTQCLRVPVSNGHTAAVFVKFENKPTIEEIKEIWANYKGEPQTLKIPNKSHPLRDAAFCLIEARNLFPAVLWLPVQFSPLRIL
ncbi:MAG: hypothetical protein II230_00620, partial [Clostridia bacterium]|nr:hypothetical protein [Clostridia bacterium]